MQIPEWLYWFLISTGVTVIVVLFYLRMQWQRFVRVMTVLQQENERSECDLISFLDALPQSLSRLPNVAVGWRLSWFGQVIERGVLCTQSSAPLSFDVKQMEVHLHVCLFTEGVRWEAMFYHQLLLQQIKALCELDIALKLRQVNSVEQTVARYQLFLAHDLKNLAQLMVLWQRQVQSTTPDGAAAAVVQWQNMLPIMVDRSERLAAKLSAPGDVQAQASLEVVSIADICAHADRWSRVHGVTLKMMSLDSPVCVRGAWDRLDDALFQMMRNYQQYVDLVLPVSLSYQKAGGWVLLSFHHPQIVEDVGFKRMLEPLWTSSEQGMGLGLWQIGQALSDCMGRLELVHQDDKSVVFKWWLRYIDCE